jgi:hypothetical protein
MMYTASEKLAIIRLVEESELSIRRSRSAEPASTVGIEPMRSVGWMALRIKAGQCDSTGIGFLTPSGN